MLPLDESPWQAGADTVPILLAPACGAVRSLPQALGAYRGAGPDDWLPSARHGALSEACRRVLQGKQALAAALDHLVIPRRRELALAPWEARTLVMGLRLGPADPALPRARTAGRALRAVLRWPDLRLGERLLMLGWMAGVLLLPRALAGRLARQHRRLSGRETPTC